MTEKKAIILLGTVIAARSTSFLFSKILLEEMGIFNLLAVRFLLAFFILSIIFYKKIIFTNFKSLLKGFSLGILFFMLMVAELTGLKTTPSSTTSLLENTAIMIVPMMECFFRRKFPDIKTLIGTLLAFTGVVLLTSNASFSLSTGELFCLLAAFLYAIYIIVIDRITSQDDPIVMGIFQIGFLGIFSLIASFIFESPILPTSELAWTHMSILIVVCTVFGLTLQPLAQKYTTSEKASIFCALNPVVAAILGVIFLNESMTVLGIIGSILILISMFIPMLNINSQSRLNVMKNSVNTRINSKK
ncbi:DMT family transporter [Peptostreptococcus equinus]|uniref:DMT family transporter n=1 Tax=Peptostreptococcus equinus TaxID=3003601 RepID=A0ABY7JSK3_9FIRM|nr:DMT family transporter [Peptostreptococcus sp. CBA3647]WAW14912.1 DMT family transporter [Peptostreptococcus sp. CBA3647]